MLHKLSVHPSIECPSWPLYTFLWLFIHYTGPCYTKFLPALHPTPIMTLVQPSLAIFFFFTFPILHKLSSIPPSNACHDPYTTVFGYISTFPMLHKLSVHPSIERPSLPLYNRLWLQLIPLLTFNNCPSSTFFLFSVHLPFTNITSFP